MKNRFASLCICAALCLIIGIGLSACGGSGKVSEDATPSETVSAFLDAFKAEDEAALKQVYAGKTDDFMSAYKDGALDDDIPEELLDALMEKWHDFDYEITGEKIASDGETATVDMTITTYNMIQVFNSFYEEFIGQALEKYSGKSMDVTQEEYTQMGYQILQEELEKAKKNYEGKASLSLTKTDGRWVVDQIDENNEDFLNAVTGGMMDALLDVVDTLDEEEED